MARGSSRPHKTNLSRRRGMPLLSLFFLLLVLICDGSVLIGASANEETSWRPVRSKPLNILLILADDLGYGDTSVFPFVGSGVVTPQLEKMAQRGVVMTNYHTAAATCTPSRASLLTGMNPWRMGIKAVFEYGEKGSSNRDDWLVQVPTAPMIFAEHNYFTFHSGKWHLGGMRNDDLDMRLLPVNRSTDSQRTGFKRCHHPGPNQQGFQNYVSVLDGPGAPRQNELQVSDQLYSKGCQFLLENDQKLPQSKYNISGWLSYCEAQHAMRAMTQATKNEQPFYIHLWFHAPHGPWQTIPGYDHLYKTRSRNERFMHYRTMVSDMDKQIGMVLNHIDSLGIAKDTLIVFTSDNGPEDAAGTAGGFRGNKRHLYEGGIRVPAIAQWTGVLPEGGVSHSLVTSTDIFATFLDAAGIAIPKHVHTDGMSMLYELITAPQVAALTHQMGNSEKVAAIKAAGHDNTRKKGHYFHRRKQQAQERVTLWMNDYEGPRRTAAILFDYKILLDEKEIPFEMFDLRFDSKEERNLLAVHQQSPEWTRLMRRFDALNTSLPSQPVQPEHTTPSSKSVEAKLTRSTLLKKRDDPAMHLAIVESLYHTMYNYARRGDEGYRNYLQSHPGLKYDPSPLSDQRPTVTNIFRKGMTLPKAEEIRVKLMKTGTCGVTPCPCEIQTVTNVQPLPFPGLHDNVDVSPDMWWNPIVPQPFLNASRILHLHY